MYVIYFDGVATKTPFRKMVGFIFKDNSSIVRGAVGYKLSEFQIMNKNPPTPWGHEACK